MPVPKICYTAIFKNESKNVYRCLNALKSIIDCVSICDTGSTDNTVELIKQWGIENKIPTSVHAGPEQIFKNFGYNRTLSYRRAIESFPSADYLLLVDADMVIKVETTFDKKKLTADYYLFEQVSPGLRYWNTRLISTTCKWECVGVTHEYWEPKKQGISQVKTKDIWINDIGDGGSKENKFKRDVKLLTEGLEDPATPDSLKGRYMFYLANSYKDLREYRSAVEWYSTKIKAGGWDEEIFYCYFNMGKCYLELNEIGEAVNAFLLAYDTRPTRSETIYELSKLYRTQEKYKIAFKFAEIGYNIKYPENDNLFILPDVYQYLFLEEIYLTAFYNEAHKQKGKACIIKILNMREKIPEDHYKLALENAKWYGIDNVDTLIKSFEAK